MRISKTVHLHIVKLSNCCVERRQTLFCWIYDIQTAHTSTSWPSVMDHHSGMCLHSDIQSIDMNWNSGWFRSGALLIRTLLTWLLTNGVKDFQQAFVQGQSFPEHHVNSIIATT